MPGTHLRSAPNVIVNLKRMLLANAHRRDRGVDVVLQMRRIFCAVSQVFDK